MLLVTAHLPRLQFAEERLQRRWLSALDVLLRDLCVGLERWLVMIRIIHLINIGLNFAHDLDFRLPGGHDFLVARVDRHHSRLAIACLLLVQNFLRLFQRLALRGLEPHCIHLLPLLLRLKLAQLE